MWTSEKERLAEQLINLLDEPWDNNAELNLDLFHKLGRLQGVTLLVSSPLSKRSSQIIKGISCLLARVEEYPNEITSLYMWLEAVAELLDESSAGCLATAIQGHIAMFSIQLPLEPGIEKVMIPFLLRNLTENDWTTRDSAASSLDMLDGISRLGKWFTKEQVAELRQNLKEFLRLNEEQDVSFLSLGRLARFVKR